MKNVLVMSLLLTAALVFGGCATNEEVTLEVLNPMGIIEPAKTLGLAPRISELAGKKIALMHNNKPGAANLYKVLEELLKQEYPDITFARQYQTGPVLPPSDPDMYKKAAAECDAFVFAMGD